MRVSYEQYSGACCFIQAFQLWPEHRLHEVNEPFAVKCGAYIRRNKIFHNCAEILSNLLVFLFNAVTLIQQFVYTTQLQLHTVCLSCVSSRNYLLRKCIWHQVFNFGRVKMYVRVYFSLFVFRLCHRFISIKV